MKSAPIFICRISAVRAYFIMQDYNCGRSTADDSEQRSADFASNSGVEVLVSREYDDVGVHTTDKGGGEDCQWCKARCGTNVPYKLAYERGMFERHPGCGCIITYQSKKGKLTVQGKDGVWREAANNEAEKNYCFQ